MLQHFFVKYETIHLYTLLIGMTMKRRRLKKSKVNALVGFGLGQGRFKMSYKI